MKPNCEECGLPLPTDAEAYVCSYECTFCPECASKRHNLCSHCGGELVRRPRRTNRTESAKQKPDQPALRAWLVWAISFGVWTLIAIAGAVTMYQFNRMRGLPRTLVDMVILELSQSLTYAPLTPFVFLIACRYPIQRGAWRLRVVLYIFGGFLFTLAHVFLRGLTYKVWDVATASYASAIWNSQAHVLKVRWDLFQSLFFYNVVDDITGTYVPIVLIAHVMSYYTSFRQRELRASQLQAQLAKARLQALKSQLQPHFLFNTMHSISALMLTDVRAADRMMTRLSDLLRMSLEAEGTQVIALNHELDFVNCYLEIEKIRFEERLNIIWDISPETLDAQVPHLLLQPLVDNAVKHGIARLPAAGQIRITVKSQGGELQLEISDNGPGFGKAGSFQHIGLGLRITRERLESLYGQDQSMELLSPPEGGSTVRVCIPFRSQPAESKGGSAFVALPQTG